MKGIIFRVTVALWVSFSVVPAFSETKTWGWRGDGTGLFPDADPPITWRRTSAMMAGLKSQAEKPDSNGAAAATLVEYGNISRWLILAPASTEDPVDESALRPNVGDQAAGATWKTVEASGQVLDFSRLLPNHSGRSVYAHSYLHAAKDGRVLLRMRCNLKCTVWVNGEQVYRSTRMKRPADVAVDLSAGWNRLLVHADGYIKLVMFGTEPDEFQTNNVVWSVQIPQAGRFSCAQPVIVDDRVFVNADPEFLICYDKNTGERLWISYNGGAETLTAEDRQSHPDLCTQIDAKAGELKDLVANYQGTVEERIKLNEVAVEIDGTARKGGLLRQLDDKRYSGVDNRQEAGIAGMTSVTDGKHIYTWFASGIVTCHDLAGNRKWITLKHDGKRKLYDRHDRHGYQVSPILTKDTFICSQATIKGFDKETGEHKWTMPGQISWPRPRRRGPTIGDEVNHINFYEVGLYVRGEGFFPWSKVTQAGNKAYAHGGQVGGMVEFTIPNEIDKTTELATRSPSKSFREAAAPHIAPGNLFPTYQIANVLVHDGLIYLVSIGGVLHVIDAETMELVYSKGLDLNTTAWPYPYPHGSGVCASPTLGGRYIYLWGNGGTTLVIKPGREYEVVAKNRIERLLPGSSGLNERAYMPIPGKGDGYPECTVTSPIFDGNRLYYQGERYLYCIGNS